MEVGKKGLIALIIAAILIPAMIVWFAAGNYYTELGQPPVELSAAQRNAFDVVRAMGAGWNLGNALDSVDNQRRGITGNLPANITANEFYETLWGNPVTTPEIIESIAQMGFGAMRVPVTYTDHLDENFIIRPEWLARVEQVVNYVLDNDMYCIINIHHDTGSGAWPWLRADPRNIAWMEEKLAVVWTQIAEHFKDYGDRLIFEGFNEILDAESNWNDASRSAHNAVNRLNQVFVDTVRGTGGNNAERFLIVKTYAASTRADVLASFKLPNDSAESRLIVGVHNYGVRSFTWNDWTDTYSDWDYVRDGLPVEAMIRRLYEAFVSQGIPVIIGEFGAENKNNTADRIKFAEHYVAAARRYGITCFWWDDGGQALDAEGIRNFALFDRHRNKWHFPEIAEAIIQAAR